MQKETDILIFHPIARPTTRQSKDFGTERFHTEIFIPNTGSVPTRFSIEVAEEASSYAILL